MEILARACFWDPTRDPSWDSNPTWVPAVNQTYIENVWRVKIPPGILPIPSGIPLGIPPGMPGGIPTNILQLLSRFPSRNDSNDTVESKWLFTYKSYIFIYIYIQYLQELHLAINSGPRSLTEDTVAYLTE